MKYPPKCEFNQFYSSGDCASSISKQVPVTILSMCQIIGLPSFVISLQVHFLKKGQELKYYHSHRDQFSFDSKVLQAQICICSVVMLKISTNCRFWMSLLLFVMFYIFCSGEKKKTLSSFIRCFTIVFICKIISTLIKYFLTQGNSSWVMTKRMYWLVLVVKIRQNLVSQVLELLIRVHCCC